MSAVGILIGFGIESQSPCVIDLSMLWYLDQPPLVCCLKSDGNGSQNSVGDQYRRNPVSIHYWFPVPDHQGFQCQISCGSYSQTLWFPIALLVVIESQNRIPLTQNDHAFADEIEYTNERRLTCHIFYSLERPELQFGAFRYGFVIKNGR